MAFSAAGSCTNDETTRLISVSTRSSSGLLIALDALTFSIRSTWGLSSNERGEIRLLQVLANP